VAGHAARVRPGVRRHQGDAHIGPDRTALCSCNGWPSGTSSSTRS
jgi:hypothetical protein